MIWLVWRRQRAALLFALALLAAVALLMALGGIGLRAGRVPAAAGPPALVLIVRTVLLVLPGLVGVIAGAGLFGRELERGTHVFALTQSVSRLRWWLTGLVVTGLPVVVGVALVTWLAGWALGPHGMDFPLATPFFDSSGLVPIGHVLLAFTVAAGTGLVARNALAAVAVGVGVVMVVQIVLAAGYRMNYLPPEHARVGVSALTDRPLVGSRWLESAPVDTAGAPVAPPPPGCVVPGDPVPCLRAAGATAVEVVYQPASRYWPFQAIETGVLLSLSAAALGVGYWGLRRQVS